MNQEEHNLSTTLRSCYCTPFDHFPTSFVQIVECQFNYYIKRSNLDCGVNISGENVGKRGGSESCYDAPCEGFGNTSRTGCVHVYRLLINGLRKKCSVCNAHMLQQLLVIRSVPSIYLKHTTFRARHGFHFFSQN